MIRKSEIFREIVDCLLSTKLRILRKRTSIFVETLLFVPFILSPPPKPAFRASRTPSSLLQLATFRKKSMMRRGGRGIFLGDKYYSSHVCITAWGPGRAGGAKTWGGMKNGSGSHRKCRHWKINWDIAFKKGRVAGGVTPALTPCLPALSN